MAHYVVHHETPDLPYDREGEVSASPSDLLVVHGGIDSCYPSYTSLHVCVCVCVCVENGIQRVLGWVMTVSRTSYLTQHGMQIGEKPS